MSSAGRSPSRPPTLLFIDAYANGSIEAARARGASGADLARVTAEMEKFRTEYANPLVRLPMTFVEIFPVGVLISLISAGLLRNSRFLASRAVAGAGARAQ